MELGRARLRLDPLLQQLRCCHLPLRGRNRGENESERLPTTGLVVERVLDRLVACLRVGVALRLFREALLLEALAGLLAASLGLVFVRHEYLQPATKAAAPTIVSHATADR
jgi:hypothetical protein